MPWTTLIGLNDQPVALSGFDLSGSGPVPAALARAIAAEAATHTVIALPDASPVMTAASGQAVAAAQRLSAYHGPGDHARCPNRGRPYALRQSLIDRVIFVHRTCRFPDCTRPAHRCDMDHVRPYGQGGSSCLCNVMPLCRLHHRLKTHGGWQARFTTPDEIHPCGTVEWVSPHGRRYYAPPPLNPEPLNP
jgi:hypothetical protein